MYIVNAGTGFRKMLWPAAQKFLDPKTISKIQVKDTTIISVGNNIKMFISCSAADFIFISLIFRFSTRNLYINYRKSLTLGTPLSLHCTIVISI
jgi:hypothetical protein